MPQDYNNTLNLPQSDFPMRGNLPAREPGMLEKWEKSDRYQKMVDRNEGKPRYVLHDGPPYANGDIHLGTALNKVLKDIVVKSKNMSGYQAPYVDVYKRQLESFSKRMFCLRWRIPFTCWTNTPPMNGLFLKS